MLFSDYSFLSYLAVGMAYDILLAKETILLIEISFDDFSLSVQSPLEFM